MRMVKVAKNRADLEEIIRIKSRAIGPWPKNMSVLVYPLGDAWGAMIGFSDVSQTEFRDKALALCRELRETYDLIE
jgi:hypothetical protein